LSGRGSSYAELIESELRAELDRKAITDARAASVITNSGAIVAILVALGAFLTDQGRLSLPWYGSLLVVSALGALAAASFAGIIAGRLYKYQVTGTKSMDLMVSDCWDDDEDFARQAVAHIRIKLIKRLRHVNARKTWWLHFGWWCQIAALMALAVVVAVMLLDW
jgi:hypothetical protein